MKKLLLATLTTVLFSSAAFAGQFEGTWNTNAYGKVISIKIEQSGDKVKVHKYSPYGGKATLTYKADGDFLKYPDGSQAYALENGILVGKHADSSRYTKQ